MSGAKQTDRSLRLLRVLTDLPQLQNLALDDPLDLTGGETRKGEAGAFIEVIQGV